jgi:cytochrome c oxidase cbb3-type subunit III
MPTKVEKDALSGRETTGHEWDGLKELNNPLPKWWLWVFVATVVWAVIWMALYPSVPFITGHTAGLLGYSQRDRVDADVAALVKQRSAVMDKIAATPLADIKNDPALYATAMTAGRIAFANNCQPCHGTNGEGRPGYPNLADDTWLWGGKLAQIQQTILHGVRSGDPDAHQSAMPRFGVDAMLKPEEIQQVADYVYADLYGHGDSGATAANVAAGKELFAANCAVCHGDNGQGNQDVGAPALKSQTHLYGDTRSAIVNQVTNPHMGVMPAWGKRLDKATTDSLALFVHGLGGGE